jgi:hypothetical protein
MIYKLGRELFSSAVDQLGSELFSWAMINKIYTDDFLSILASFLIILAPISGMKKTDGSWFFGPHFDVFDHFWSLYGFIEKQAPQKALCLGPDPPLGNSIKFIDFYDFLRF